MPPPILLHGFTGSSASWGGRIVDGLSSAELEPELLDLPGHGRWRGETRVEWFTLDRVLSALGGAVASPADLVGYSMGGRIALHFAAKYPERVSRLVLESASPGLEGDRDRAVRRTADEALAARIQSEGIEWFVDYWEARPLFGGRSHREGAGESIQRGVRLENHPGSLAAALRGLGTGCLPSLWNRLPEIRTPTLLLVGELDEKFVAVAGRMEAAMPDVRLVIVEGAAHRVHIERPDVWLQEVTRFLQPA